MIHVMGRSRNLKVTSAFTNLAPCATFHRQYTTPHYANLASTASVGVKLVAHVFHGTCMCLYLVDQWVRDDANLVATLELVTLEKALHVRPF